MTEPNRIGRKRPVTGCRACDDGCDCQARTPGCSHFACWGVVSDELYNSCPSAAVWVEHHNRRLAVAR